MNHLPIESLSTKPDIFFLRGSVCTQNYIDGWGHKKNASGDTHIMSLLNVGECDVSLRLCNITLTLPLEFT